MYRDRTVGVVVPSYNEEEFVGNVIDTVPSYVDRIYAIDDCSNDDTWTEIRRHAAKMNGCASVASADGHAPVSKAETDAGFDRRVVPIRHEENRGVGGVIKTGYLRAREDELDITAVLAGDGQMDPRHLPRLLDPIVDGAADYTKGNRLIAKEYRTDMPRFRLYGNAILTHLTRISSGYWKVMDPQNGYTAISLGALERLPIEDLYEYYGYPNDLLVKLNADEMRVADVPMPAVYGDEESTIRYPSYVRKVSVLLARNFLWRVSVRYVERDFNPKEPLYTAAFIAAAIGTLGGLRTLLSEHRPQKKRVLLAVSSCILFVGVLVPSIGDLLKADGEWDTGVRIYD
ncbi:glycosyltransferase family 2 protein [Natrinema marinum]|uniref:glycosyltransferase family 2 protein n=1 Tax=Natrinema marinum TaxID=2961598 RepID=UPI0020C86AF1|nr:glycosyltransferase family 2 protein [Natrinema marinum]